jgi:hypothetical protein
MYHLFRHSFVIGAVAIRKRGQHSGTLKALLVPMLILLPTTSSEITAALSLAGIFNFDQRIRKLKGNNVIFHLLNRKGRLPFKNEHMLTAKNSY